MTKVGDITLKADLPEDESKRLDTLHQYQILDTLPEPEFDELTQLASQICDAPIALISLVDAHRQWFKSRVGIDATETHRDLAFCSHAILKPNEPLVVPDATKDNRFQNNPLVTNDPHIRFYFGMPLVNTDGHALGTMCIIDRVPRNLTEHQVNAVQVLGRQVISQLELRLKLRQMAKLVDQVESAKIKLEHSNQDLTQFTSVVSHDLKSPLRSIHMMSELLRNDCEEYISKAGQGYLEHLTSATQRMHYLLDDLLDYALVTTTNGSFQQVDLTDIVEQVISDIAQEIEQSSGRVEIQTLPQIDADATQMRQLFQNLISNSIKFQQQEIAPVVHIQTQIVAKEEGLEDSGDASGDGPWCRIFVRDNGIGFEHRYSEQIFDIFQRLHPQELYQGTGMGLTICRRVVEHHNGTIKAQSEPGQGTTMIITLPVRQKINPWNVTGQPHNRPAA